jgi:hypothetical protein
VQGDAGNAAVPVRVLPWQVHTASALGAGHVRDSLPNQDSVGHRLMVSPGGSAVLAIVVADGHGDPRHFRSDRGSAMAVAAGLAAMEAWSAPVTGGPAAVRESAGAILVPAIVTQWNALVAADLTADPLSDAERTKLERLSLPDVIAYGSTLLAAAFTPEYGVFAQIGDGDIVAVLPGGRAFGPVPADNSLDGWQTTSLCQPDAGAAFRTGVVPLADWPLSAVLLATDGFGNAQADDPWQPAFAADLAQLGADHEPGWFAGQVPDWVAQCASADGSGDDTTMALVIRSGAGPGTTASRPGQTVGPHTRTMPARTLEWPSPGYAPVPGNWPRGAEPAAQPRGAGPAAGFAGPGRARGLTRRLRLRPLWLAVAIVVALGGISLALLLGSHRTPGPAPQPRPTPQTSQRPTPHPSQRPGHHRSHKHRHSTNSGSNSPGHPRSGPRTSKPAPNPASRQVSGTAPGTGSGPGRRPAVRHAPAKDAASPITAKETDR